MSTMADYEKNYHAIAHDLLEQTLQHSVWSEMIDEEGKEIESLQKEMADLETMEQALKDDQSG